jgi:hypothetical protein
MAKGLAVYVTSDGRTVDDVLAEARHLQVETRQLIARAWEIMDRCECCRMRMDAFAPPPEAEDGGE